MLHCLLAMLTTVSPPVPFQVDVPAIPPRGSAFESIDPLVHATDSVPPPDLATLPFESRWTLTWDDVVDDSASGPEKVCTVQLEAAEGVLAGRFVGPVAGTVRQAVITGSLLPPAPESLLTLRQCEPGYTCLYQARRLPNGTFLGVWHDTRGGSGDFTLVAARAAD